MKLTSVDPFIENGIVNVKKSAGGISRKTADGPSDRSDAEKQANKHKKYNVMQPMNETI